jgi:hypothetical protein
MHRRAPAAEACGEGRPVDRFPSPRCRPPPRLQEYLEQIRMMREFDTTTLFVDYEHLQKTDPHVAAAITEEYYR